MTEDLPCNTVQRICCKYEWYSEEHVIKQLQAFATIGLVVDKHTVLPESLSRLAHTICDSYSEGWEDGRYHTLQEEEWQAIECQEW